MVCVSGAVCSRGYQIGLYRRAIARGRVSGWDAGFEVYYRVTVRGGEKAHASRCFRYHTYAASRQVERLVQLYTLEREAAHHLWTRTTDTLACASDDVTDRRSRYDNISPCLIVTERVLLVQGSLVNLIVHWLPFATRIITIPYLRRT